MRSINFARIIWLCLPLVVGSPLQAAVARLDGVAATASATVLVGAAWLVGCAALAVPRVPTLTALRLVAPAPIVAALWAVSGGDATVESALAVGVATGASLTMFAPVIGEAFVDGSSCGDEQRIPLRPPVTITLTVVTALWSISAAAFAGAVSAFDGDGPAIGVILLLVGAAATTVLATRTHALSLRWLVIVPAGVVVHDRMAMAEPLLVRANTVREFAPAQIDDDAIDLTLGARGLILRLDLTEPTTFSLNATGADTSTTSMLLAPTRPGHALESFGTRHRR